ncbi:bifunctional [glutamate--ammonia ligase]-adenylyl-L-tyrosine phosphorylase/[glutamate--ammonia-ligase] adenylyltransferase [Aliiglaciecola sp. CAU 1673]|uniref:bifunctional [glutamate--ammonia ligase]-adenylyl-L-tyrosine phosphorylase/[glutamate--ammonia-ligase] adenylyltransferase n=1 Tax=Aliiglaciecola sp. CAU 1673 TaxID=3032595 RepID=UPI0023D9CF9D|nr:bifunctional [glutamate--ammonia ligase]-adenylyl-L-tyrosine phosphorylase/[glutamate--ammonia-ligase] adenylyltransferase [Aliiglaciecola sp. CAU 1673]MDF2180040.1 bifunctional [glutamate--ammonia ligase]-adenylyl-L-tyrosine phosphorylase/[glutamate--ammonia-ligase] adenylyltransferase [Aliiglaciecola sp. CAU 1673]
MSIEQASAAIEASADHYWHQLQDKLGEDVISNWPEARQNALKSKFGLSDFIAKSCLQSPDMIERLFSEGPATCMPDYDAGLGEVLKAVEDETGLLKSLRLFRRYHMLRLAWLDLGNQLAIEDSLVQVSTMARAIISRTCQWWYEQLAQRYGYPMEDGKPQPLLVLGMGKLGGGELNFSSDIDLIFCYPTPGDTQGGKKTIENQQFFTKLGQKLIAALNQITADGQVFRVDMRLRPFGESGPLVVHFDALEDYYQEQGREWERYAMVKASVVNPQSDYTDRLQAILKPFVYRRYIDYSAIEALRNMKRLIAQEIRRRQLTDNIKLGAGGIREVEFIVQTFQLIRGGREPSLQNTSLLQVLSAIVERGFLPAEEAKVLRESYLYLRKVEHCLQQFADEQTQQLPDSPLNQARLATVMGFDSFAGFRIELERHMAAIHQQFQELIGEEAEQASEQDVSDLQDLWALPLSDEEAVTLLRKRWDEQHTGPFWRVLSEFASDMHHRSMGKRGKDTLDKLMPWVLLAALEDKFQPHLVLERLTSVLKAVSRRTTYLELLLENPGALSQLVKLCSASLWISKQIESFPILLDELLNPQQLYQLTSLDNYADELRQAMLRIPEEDLEAQMEALRQFKLSQQLKIAAADITGVLPVMRVSDHLTFLAEALISQVVLDAWQQMTQRYGLPKGLSEDSLGFAVIAYGKLGGLELGYGSDLDLVFLHNCDTDEETEGGKPIESRQFYLKLAQRIMHLFNTKTSSGDLYETDLRLRPSGNSGLLVCHIEAFARYQKEEAWTWEHQALCRSRFVFGDDKMQARFEQIRKDILCQPRERKNLAEDVRTMREKMRTHLSSAKEGFDLKQDPGGIADIEFLVQFWVLAFGAQFPALCQWSDNVRILESLEKAGVISAQWASLLKEAYLSFRNAGHHLVLEGKPPEDGSDRFDSLREKVIAIWNAVLVEV